jgi:ribosome-binding factor A
MAPESSRKNKVAAEIQRLVNDLLRTEVKDPRLAGATVSAVEVSGDLGVATVFFSTIALDEDPANIREGFEKARGFLRTRVGQALSLRRVPELRFRHDTSARRGVEMGRLIDEAGADRARD